MSDPYQELEDQLRRALRPVDPRAGFAERIAARLPGRRPPHGLGERSDWLRVALAAGLVLSVLAASGWREYRQREGLHARQQLMQALRVTSQKLDLAYRGVQDASKSAGSPGADAT